MLASSNLGKLERWSGWILLVNGALGLAVTLGRAVFSGSAWAFLAPALWLSLLGVAAGCLALREKLAGLVGGMLFYGLQVASFYSRGFQFGVRSGISLATVFDLPGGVLVVNGAALAGLAVIVLILARGRCPPSIKSVS